LNEYKVQRNFVPLRLAFAKRKFRLVAIFGTGAIRHWGPWMGTEI